ncbi:hypothetical protein ScalyP_jg8036 [Parmales sp. scaly parma]|nr:hypothetical protein ScalyP_jg8036 [Parmales sp. scaly parma]
MSEFYSAPSPASIQEAPTGFDFSYSIRNQMILNSQSTNTNSTITPLATKTGTTIVGMCFEGGVVLGADTRATGGTEVADKNCEKIHFLSDNIWCCGAGTAADTEKTTELISSQLELLRMDTGSQSRVVTACTLLKRMLFNNQGQISAALVLGGCDINGPHIFQIHPHGSTANLPYCTMGSGSLAAMSVFETEWKEGMNEAEATELVKKAILAGIFNDLGSGSSCDYAVIRMDGSHEVVRGAVQPNSVKPLRDAINRSAKLTMPKGTTAVLKTTFVAHAVSLADVDISMSE